MSAPASESRPYLTVVATARNDNHGGNPLYRMQLFVDGLVAQCVRHRVRAELVLVEWNPPQDTPRLRDAVNWPNTNGWCEVRIVEVPAELHRPLAYSDRLPLFQMIAKNVGIRRARGEFVLATNIDLIFSDELMRFISAQQFRPGRLYRVDRYDVPAELEPSWPIDRQLAYCEKAVIRVNRCEGTLDLRTGEFHRIYRLRTPAAWLRNAPRGRRLAVSAPGRLLRLDQLAVRRRPLERRFPAERHGLVAKLMTVVAGVAGILLLVSSRLYAVCYWFVAGLFPPQAVPGRVWRRLRRLVAAVAPVLRTDRGDQPAASPFRRSLDAVSAANAALKELIRRKNRAAAAVWLYESARVRLHTNASGDFTLMSRADWERSGGYLEFEMYSMHIDTLLLYAAHNVGIGEIDLPFAVYHIEHGDGFRPEDKGATSLDSLLARRSIPQISYEEMLGYILQMHATRRPLEFNGSDWGMSATTLAEHSPGALALTQTARTA